MIADLAEQASKTSDRAAAIRTFIMRAAMLRECGLATMDDMIIGIYLQKFAATKAPAMVSTDPAALTAADATAIGIGFGRIIFMSATHVEAVHELLQKYPALGTMSQQHCWFRPMLETIAKRRMASSPLGLKLRLGIGAGFSVGSMASDITSIVGMLRQGYVLGAYGMIGLISMSLAMQLLVCIVVSKHRGWTAVAWEAIFVLSLAKPGVDAMRVASGAERVAGAPIDPFAEMIIGKVLEIAFRAAPGTALHAYAVLSGHSTTAAVVSVGLSCAAIGFSSSMMAFDLDTNPAYRKKEPEFYGFIPTDQPLLVFAELLTLHTAHAMLKTGTLVLLARTNWHWLLAYVVADHCTFILYKVARGDLTYFTPGEEKGSAIIWRHYGHCISLPQLLFTYAQVLVFRCPSLPGWS
jgi:hypothetical protein